MKILGKQENSNLKSEMMKLKRDSLAMEYEDIEENYFDYNQIREDGYNLSEKDEFELIRAGKIIKGAKGKILKSFSDLQKALETAIEILPKDGTFSRWCESMGLTPGDVSLFYKKKEVHELTGLTYEEIEEKPQQVIKDITNKKLELEKNEIMEIMKAENPREILTKIKKERKQSEPHEKNDDSMKESKVLEIGKNEFLNDNNVISGEDSSVFVGAEIINSPQDDSSHIIKNSEEDIHRAEEEINEIMHIQNYLNTVRFNEAVSTSELYQSLYMMFKKEFEREENE